MKKILCLLALLSGSCLNVGYASSPIMTIIPSTPSLTVRTDGSTSILYTVTNNASSALSGLQVNPYYHSTSQANSLTLQNDTCSSQTLSAHASCQFGLVINGADQDSHFTLSPSVCANGGQACSTTTSSGVLTVNVDTVTQPAFSYNQLSYASITSHERGLLTDPVTAYALLPINTATNALGTPVTGLHFLTDNNYQGSVSVALDGTRVYTAEQPNVDSGGTADIAVLSAGANSQLLKRIALPDITSTTFFSTVLSPNGNTLYVSSFLVDSSRGVVYAIDLATDQVTTVPLDFILPMGLAISPDGSRLYVCDAVGGEDQAGSVSVVNTTNFSLMTTLDNAHYPTVFGEPIQVAISPDNSKLYFLNSVAVVAFLINADGTYTYQTSIPTDDIYKPTSLVFSSDSDYLYVTNAVRGAHLYQVDTRTNAVTNTVINNSFSLGIALTPENSTAWLVSESTSSAALDTVLGLPIGDATSAAPITIASVLPSATTLPQVGVFIN